MPPVGYQPASARPQTYALNGAAIVIGCSVIMNAMLEIRMVHLKSFLLALERYGEGRYSSILVSLQRPSNKIQECTYPLPPYTSLDLLS